MVCIAAVEIGLCDNRSWIEGIYESTSIYPEMFVWAMAEDSHAEDEPDKQPR